MYPYLRYGDKLPSVAAVQILINRKMRSGTYIAVDGHYGSETRIAVKKFQEEGCNYRGASGIVDKRAWKALIMGQNLQVLDSVDLTDPEDIGYEDKAIKIAGGEPILNYGMSNGTRNVRDKILARSIIGKVVLLRFHGHGSPGVMLLTAGKQYHIGSQFSVAYLSSLAKFVSPLSRIFASYGSVEFHGCRVGAGRDGKRLVDALAKSWGVPVTAGLKNQYGGGMATFRFEGPTYTGFPKGNNMRSWIRSLPISEIYRISVDRQQYGSCEF